jgi:hypothetical protein
MFFSSLSRGILCDATSSSLRKSLVVAADRPECDTVFSRCDVLRCGGGGGGGVCVCV